MPSQVAILSQIATEIYGCTLCPLHQGRTRVVPGYGDPNADIMFIGEAPGKNEDEQGLPFVGRSGKYLDELLAGIGLSREQVFIANVVKCRPPDNRDPSPHEIDSCNPYLQRQIEAIDPLVIATLGRYSMSMFFPDAKISQIHGQPKYDQRRAYYPLFHPAYVLRNGNERPAMARDFAGLLDTVAEVKQRRAAGIVPAPDEALPEPLAPDDADDDISQMTLF